jgi:hypothetical protein
MPPSSSSLAVARHVKCFCLVLQKFFTSLSVRPGRQLAILAHLLPSFACISTTNLSSSEENLHPLLHDPKKERLKNSITHSTFGSIGGWGEALLAGNAFHPGPQVSPSVHWVEGIDSSVSPFIKIKDGPNAFK